MLQSLPQSHSSTVPPPTSDSLNMQPTSLDYASSNREEQPSNHYSHDQHQHAKGSNPSTGPSSPVKTESPTRPYPNAPVSQPTTPKPTGSPTLQPLHSITQPPSPNQGYQSQQETHLQATAPPYLISSSIRRKRRESDYTSDTPTFGMTSYNGNIYATDKSTVLDIHIQSKVDRGFFLAENDWTCYRRNYFQVSSSFSLQGVVVLYDGQELPCFVQDQDMLHEVDQFYLGITARLSDCDKQILLIQHTAKRDKGPQNTPEPKPIRPGGNLSFSSVGANQSIVTFERIQFKSATANNGKRRAAQQYYVVVMELYAKTRYTGKLVPVASTQSQPLVVRGRSPGHYAESHGSSPSSGIGNEGNTVGGPMRRQQYRHHPSSHSYPGSALTSPPVIPGHPHTPTYQSHAPPPGMYASEYPSTYDYPTPSSHSSGNGMHYVYASHGNVPMTHSAPLPPPPPPPPQHTNHPPPSSSNGPYEYHTSPTSQPQSSLPPPPQQHAYPQQRPDAPSTVYDHPYPPPIQHHPYPSLPSPMHRSESAPSTYDHFKEDEQQQHWARFRMTSTPGHIHSENHSPTTDHSHSPYMSRPSTHDHSHHTYYSQAQQPMSYYHPPPTGYDHPSSIPPPPVDSYQPGYASNWQQWRPQGSVGHAMEDYPGKGSQENTVKTETKH